MLNVQDNNLNRPRQWQPRPTTVEQIVAAVNRATYPPARRSGAGPAVRTAR